MRKVVTILFSTGLMFFLSLPVDASVVNPYSPDLALLQGMLKTWDAANTTSTEFSKTTVGSAVRFVADMQYGDGFSDGWAQMGVGYGFPPPPAVVDLSAYDGYRLNFLNTNNSSWFVNLYMNTGWTDAPYGETDHFYQDGWIELLPNASTIVTLDFSAVNAVNLNHVTNIGFEIGANMDAYPPYNPNNPSNPDTYHIDVSQIPEPATMCLLGLGALSLLRKRRA
jgi:hypothetical protein